MPQTTDSEATITAGKNKLANICIYGQIKANNLMKDIAGGQMPNNAKQLSRDLIAAAARILRPDITPELVRDILHYRSRKVRCLLKEWKSGKLDTPLEQRLIECEKALLNTLELGIILPTNFMEMPEINNRSLEIIAQMQAYIMDPNFRSILLATLPPLESNSRHHADGSTSKQSKETENDSIDAKNVGGDQESDVDSVHASSSSFEDQCAPAIDQPNHQHQQLFNLNYPEHLQAVLLNSATSLNNAMNEQIKSVPLVDNRRSSIISGTTTTGSSLNGISGSSNTQQPSNKTMAGRKRKFEETQMEIIEMKKELIRLQQVAFERQIEMCDQIVGMLKDMRNWMDIQKRASVMPQPNNGLSSLQQLNSLPNSITNTYPLLSNQLSSNLSTLTSLLAGATTVTSPQFM